MGVSEDKAKAHFRTQTSFYFRWRPSGAARVMSPARGTSPSIDTERKFASGSPSSLGLVRSVAGP